MFPSANLTTIFGRFLRISQMWRSFKVKDEMIKDFLDSLANAGIDFVSELPDS
jgi:hypothetical protein